MARLGSRAGWMRGPEAAFRTGFAGRSITRITGNRVVWYLKGEIPGCSGATPAPGSSRTLQLPGFALQSDSTSCCRRGCMAVFHPGVVALHAFEGRVARLRRSGRVFRGRGATSGRKPDMLSFSSQRLRPIRSKPALRRVSLMRSLPRVRPASRGSGSTGRSPPGYDPGHKPYSGSRLVPPARIDDTRRQE